MGFSKEHLLSPSRVLILRFDFYVPFEPFSLHTLLTFGFAYENFQNFVKDFVCFWRKNLRCDAILAPFMWNLALPWGFTAIFHKRGNMVK